MASSIALRPGLMTAATLRTCMVATAAISAVAPITLRIGSR
jgi:hypothetical protein